MGARTGGSRSYWCDPDRAAADQIQRLLDELAEAVSRRRGRYRGLCQTRVARVSGLSQSQVSRIERISGEHLLRLRIGLVIRYIEAVNAGSDGSDDVAGQRVAAEAATESRLAALQHDLDRSRWAMLKARMAPADVARAAGLNGSQVYRVETMAAGSVGKLAVGTALSYPAAVFRLAMERKVL